MSTHTDFRAVYFPYCIEKQANGNWVVLNRSYKPVGFNTDDFVTYEQHPVSACLSGLGPAKLKKLSYSGEIEGDRVYLYNDGCVPTSSAANMKLYLEKLKILAGLSLSR
ncbi:hypothetical protein [Halomonas litopenaei]|uniref:hypothetical protein n=1 Tax=Halomonas litopenaei TaxID=2109328 RepID=UPI001A8E1647|nr:hypothetical protein [Halomonas litopenaei]MBN8413593.1 hypothetical protein [Halomonas litopenaei]